MKRFKHRHRLRRLEREEDLGSLEIQVKNISTVMTDAQLATILSAVEAQVAEDVAQYWNCRRVSLNLVPKGVKLDQHMYQFIVADSSDQAFAAGYHETTVAGEPIGYAFVQTTIQAGMIPSVTISHEILEIIGDPLIDQSCMWMDIPHAQFLAQELCDPVEDDMFGYRKNGVFVSDFVTPEYFVINGRGPWDFQRHLSGPWDPNNMLSGAYQLLWDPGSGWQQVFPRNVERSGRALLYTALSRRVRRARQRFSWVRSTQ